jgi:protein TonB
VEPTKPASQPPAKETPPVEQPRDRQKPIKPTPLPEPAVPKESTLKQDTSKPKPSIKVDSKIVPRTPKEITEAREKAAEEAARAEERAQAHAAEARRKAIQKIAQSIDGAADSLNANLSQGTTVEMPGPGGEAYANYGQVIKSIYQNAWIDPLDGSNTATVVQAEVVIARDGTLLSDRILKRSGDGALDQSVQNALKRARAARFPAFPKGATDSKRTFIINFNVKEKFDVG